MDAAEICAARRTMALSIGAFADCIGADARLVMRFEADQAVPSKAQTALIRVLRDVPAALEYRLNEVNL